MEFQEVLRRRKMVRSFEDRPLPPGTVERIVSDGLRAPSAGFTQGWAFVVLEGPDETERYWSASFADTSAREGFRWPGLLRAPVLIVALAHEQAYADRYAEPDKSPGSGELTDWPAPWWYIDTAFAAMVMLLTVVDLGLGALFFGVSRPEAVKASLGIPDDYTLVGVIAVGHPAPDDRLSASVKRGHRPLGEVLHRGAW